MEHKLDLLENAVDSLNEALKCFEEGKQWDGAYKFAVLHFVHFLELLFKHCVSEAHPLLIYRDPFKKNVRNSRTIGLWEAVQFLKNDRHQFDSRFEQDLEWVKNLRNEIEHYKFTMNVSEVRLTLGRLIRATISFNEDRSVLDFARSIRVPHRETFNALADEYQNALDDAQTRASELADGGQLDLLGTAAAPCSLVSDAMGSSTAADWYGVSVKDFQSDVSLGGGTIVSNARGAFTLEESGLLSAVVMPDLSTLKDSVSFVNNLTEICLGADWYLLAPDTIPAGWTIGVAANRDAGGHPSFEVDPERTEIVSWDGFGSLHLDGAFAAGDTITFRSNDPSPEPGDWYGIRLQDQADLTGQGAVISHARGAIALEEDPAAMPDLDALGSRFVLKDNVSQVSFDRDLVVAAGDTLDIEGTWKIGFAADRRQAGGADSLCELSVSGVLRIAPDSLGSIVLTSDEPNASDGAWYGVAFNTGALFGANPGYPFSYSFIDSALVRDAKRGIAMRDQGAPTLRNVIFENNQVDIWLDSTDVYVPYRLAGQADSLGRWDLVGPTDVVADTTVETGKDIALGTPGEVDLIVYGKLNTSGNVDSMVVLRGVVSDTTGTTGDDWGGIYLTWPSGGSVIDYADIGFAPVAIYMDWPDSLTTIRNSTIHSFEDIGIWAYRPYDQGGSVENCVIRRTSLQNQYTGDFGVVVEKGGPFSVLDCEVDLTGANAAAGGAGIKHLGGPSYCDVTGGTPPIVEIAGNLVTGPGKTWPNQAWSGIELEWACVQRESLSVHDNTATEWSEAGFEVFQTVGAELSCNDLDSNWHAMSFARSTEVSGPTVRFEDSHVHKTADEAGAIRTNNRRKLEMDLGNLLRTDTGDTLIAVDGTDVTQLNARYNNWIIGGVLTTEVRTIQQHVQSADVDVANPGTDSTFTCESPWSLRLPGHAPFVTERPVAPDQRRDEAAQRAVLPEQSRLVALSPSPFRGGGMRVLFDVGRDSLGRTGICIYDVTGRRVRVLANGDLGPGSYQVYWDGRDERGRMVAAGVYFVRMERPGYAGVRKVVRLR